MIMNDSVKPGQTQSNPVKPSQTQSNLEIHGKRMNSCKNARIRRLKEEENLFPWEMGGKPSTHFRSFRSL
jgi:hypothetical protein